jgi:hypothetical protein
VAAGELTGGCVGAVATGVLAASSGVELALTVDAGRVGDGTAAMNRRWAR